MNPHPAHTLTPFLSERRLEVLTVLDQMRGEENDGNAEISDNDDNDSDDDDTRAAEAHHHLSGSEHKRRSKARVHFTDTRRSRIPVLSEEMDGLQAEVTAAMEELHQQLHHSSPVSAPPAPQTAREQLCEEGGQEEVTAPSSRSRECHERQGHPLSQTEQRHNRSHDDAEWSDSHDQSVTSPDSSTSTTSSSELTDCTQRDSSSHRSGAPHDTRGQEQQWPRQGHTDSGDLGGGQPVQRLLGHELSQERRKRLQAEALVTQMHEHVEAERARADHAATRLATVMGTLSRLEHVLSRSTEKSQGLVLLECVCEYL